MLVGVSGFYFGVILGVKAAIVVVFLHCVSREAMQDISLVKLQAVIIFCSSRF